MNNFISKNNYCYIFIMAFALLSFLSIPMGNTILGLATACFLLYLYKNRTIFHITDRTYYFAIFLFMSTMLISAFGSGNIGKGLKVWSDFWLWRMMPFFIITLALNEVTAAKKILTVAIMGITASALCALWQGIGGNARAAGFFGSPMTLAGWLCIYLPILFVCFFEKSVFGKWQWATGGILVIGFGALLFNGTRGAWLGVAIVIFLLLLYYLIQCKKMAIFILCAFLFMGVGLSQYQPLVNRIYSITDTKANSERFLMWNSAFQMFKDHPIVGVGLGQYKDNYQQKYISPNAKEPKLEHAHNNFMQMLAENGLIGFSGFLILISCFIGYSFNRFWKEKNPYALMMCTSTLALVLQGLTEYNFGNSAVMKSFWLVQGCLFVLSHTREKQNLHTTFKK